MKVFRVIPNDGRGSRALACPHCEQFITLRAKLADTTDLDAYVAAPLAVDETLECDYCGKDSLVPSRILRELGVK